MNLKSTKVQVLSQEPLCFVIDRDLLDLDNRLDTWFFHPRFTPLLEALAATKFEVLEIGDTRISSRVVDGIHKTPKYTDKGLVFIQVNNIREGEVDFITNTKRVAADWENQVLRRYSGESGDVLVTKDGTIGIAAVVPEEHPRFSIFVSVAAIKPNKEYVLPMYLATVLNTGIGQLQIDRYKRGAVLSHLLLEEIKRIEIPLPPRPIQVKVANIMQDAYEFRKGKLRESKYLIESIDNFVLEAFGIKPVESERRLAYSVQLEEDARARIDPAFYSPRYLSLLDALKRSSHLLKPLGEISSTITSGARPKGGVKYIKEGVPSIGGEHITFNGSFDFGQLRYIPKSFHEKLKKSWVKPFDVLLVKDGATTGKVALVGEDFPFKQCNINEHVFRIELEEGYNPYYIFSFLFSKLGQEQIKRLSSGAAQKGITNDAIRKIMIVVTEEIQNKVASEVQKRIEGSRKLREDALRAVIEAKTEAERIIAGYY